MLGGCNEHKHKPRRYNSDVGVRCSIIKLKVCKFGRSLGVVFPKEVIERLQTAEGEHVLLTESSDGPFRLAPSDAEFEYKMKIAREGIDRYHNTLRILAK